MTFPFRNDVVDTDDGGDALWLPESGGGVKDVARSVITPGHLFRGGNRGMWECTIGAGTPPSDGERAVMLYIKCNDGS